MGRATRSSFRSVSWIEATRLDQRGQNYLPKSACPQSRDKHLSLQPHVSKDMWNQCARHWFSTDAMEETGNLMAVMNVMDHSKPEVTRILPTP